MKPAYWKKAADEIHEDVEKTISAMRAEIFCWEHDSAAGLISETNTLLGKHQTPTSDVIPADTNDSVIDIDTQLKLNPQLDVAFDEMSDLLEKMQEEERQQEQWLQSLERMLGQLQHISTVVQTERETYQAKIASNEGEQEAAPVWRKMYLDLKDRYYEDLRRLVDETEIRIVLESNVPMRFLHSAPCQLPVELLSGGGVRMKASGSLAELATSLSAINLEPAGGKDVRLGIEIKLNNRTVPGLNRSDTVNGI